jgi:hypothetical protein
MLRGHESRPHRHDTVLRYAVTLQVCTHLNVSVARLLPQVGAGEGGGAWNRVRVDNCVDTVRAAEVPVLVCLRSSLNHVTEVEERLCFWEWGWGLSCKITWPCGSNPARSGSLSSGSKLTDAWSSWPLFSVQALVKNNWNYTSIPHIKFTTYLIITHDEKLQYFYTFCELGILKDKYALLHACLYGSYQSSVFTRKWHKWLGHRQCVLIMTPCILVKRDQKFGESQRLHLYCMRLYVILKCC